jgi:hypothetical protein
LARLKDDHATAFLDEQMLLTDSAANQEVLLLQLLPGSVLMLNTAPDSSSCDSTS